MCERSYCNIHGTFPNDNEPCWQCVNPAQQQAANEAFERGFNDGLKQAVIVIQKEIKEEPDFSV